MKKQVHPSRRTSGFFVFHTLQKYLSGSAFPAGKGLSPPVAFPPPTRMMAFEQNRATNWVFRLGRDVIEVYLSDISV